MKYLSILLVITLSIILLESPVHAQSNSSIDLLRSGLLGAGAGAVGGAASGAKGSEIWKGALAGAGVNIIGGALLDTMTRQNTAPQPRTYASQPQYYQAAPQAAAYSQPAYNSYPAPATYQGTYQEGYQAGYQMGYKEGYSQGLKDGIREALNQ